MVIKPGGKQIKKKVFFFKFTIPRLCLAGYYKICVDAGIRIGRFPVQTPPGARPGLGTQPRCEGSR